MWQWIRTHWLTVGGLVGVISGIGLFWKHIMAFLKAWWGAKEGKAKAQTAEAELWTIKRKQRVDKIARAIRVFADNAHYKEFETKTFLPLAENDLDLLSEALEYLERNGYAAKSKICGTTVWYIS